MLKTKGDSIIHSRTAEFGITFEITIAVIPRGYEFTEQTPMGDGLKYATKYAAVGWIAFTDVKLLDGMNEAGLAVGAFYFPSFAEYSAVTAENQDKGLSPADFPNWLMTQFAPVDEVRQEDIQDRTQDFSRC